MNSIRQIQELNKRELENGVSPDASWHTDYRDTAYIYIGGLPFELSEMDVIIMFSQFGEPTYINLVRDKETGKSRGFAFLKYEDQRSTDLAVDNLGGAVIMGRTLRVDHTRYKKKDDEAETGTDLNRMQIEADEGDTRRKRRKTSESESEEERPMLKEEIELAKLIQNHDEDDPMKQFLVQEKREEVQLALARIKGGKKDGSKGKEKHRRHHRSKRDSVGEDDRKHSRRRKQGEDGEDRERHSRRRREDGERKRSRSRDRDRRDDLERGNGSERPRRRESSREGKDRLRRDS